MIAETLNHHVRPRKPSASWPCQVLSPSERVIAPRSARVLLASLPAPRLTRNAVKLRAQRDPAHEGARANTIFVSLLASCQLHHIEPWAYLRDLLCLLPSWPASRVLELAPAFWQQTLQQQDTQQRLAANVFRAVTLIDRTCSPYTVVT